MLRKRLIAFERACGRYQKATITALSFVLLSLLLYVLVYHWEGQQAALSGILTSVSTIGAAAKDVVSVTAIFVGGLWAYYVFIRGRTFKRRLSIDMSLLCWAGPQNDIAVLRFRITNEGNIRIVPEVLRVTVCLGRRGLSRVEFEEFDEIDNLLVSQYPPKEGFSLEPRDRMTLDTTVYVPLLKEDGSSDTIDGLIRVTADLVDASHHRWKEQRVIPTQVKEVLP